MRRACERRASPPQGCGRPGATLLELLVVLVIMAVATAVVIPAFRTPATAPVADDADGNGAVSAFRATAAQTSVSMAAASPGSSVLLQTPDVDVVIAAARRQALARGEPVRLRAAGDGAWAIVSAQAGSPIGTGRFDAAPSWHPEMSIDAMGMCTLSAHVAPIAGATAWDALRCRWRGVAP